MQSLDNYFRSQQVPLQWSHFLRSLSQELSLLADGDAETLKNLFRAVGRRFASDLGTRFEGAKTLSDLREVFNGFWSQANWGLVELSERPDHIAIEHQFAPLGEAFGVDHLSWSIGMLEGFYQAGFAQAGADQAMTVRCAESENDGMRLIFKLATKH